MKNVFIIIGLVVLFSCESKVNYEKPKDLIPKELMIDVLYDMHLAVGTTNLKNKNLEKDRNYMSLVYEKYDIDSTRFAISNIYYTSQVDEYEEMFEEVEAQVRHYQAVRQHRLLSILCAFHSFCLLENNHITKYIFPKIEYASRPS